MLNNGGPRYKRSSLEKQMNQNVISCVFILIFLCVIGAIGCKLWLSSYPNLSLPFQENDATSEAILAFWTFIIILQVIDHRLINLFYNLIVNSSTCPLCRTERR